MIEIEYLLQEQEEALLEEEQEGKVKTLICIGSQSEGGKVKEG